MAAVVLVFAAASVPLAPLTHQVSTRLRDAVDVDTVLDELTAAVDHSREPAHVTVWVRS